MTDTGGVARNPWLLPDAVEELLPPAAARLERLRTQALATCERWGYSLVMPPMIEYLEALLSGVAHDLDLQTFKLTDQLSGRTMGVRADITPQAARIDAHQMRRDGPVRLCYSGSVLRTRPDEPGAARNPLQLGAELYGHTGIESDVEVIALMAEVLYAAGVETLHLDLGHVGIFRGLAAEAGLDGDGEARLWDALQRKAVADLEEILDALAVDDPHRSRLLALARLSGGEDVLAEAERRFAPAGEAVVNALADLRAIAAHLQRWLPQLVLHFDLGELRGYRYHTGVVFAAYVPGASQALGRGGRYDDIGAVFGRRRPATGFSTDLKTLLRVTAPTAAADEAPTGIAAPWVDDAALRRCIAELREQGEQVVWQLPGHGHAPQAVGCNRMLVSDGQGGWSVQPLEGE